MKKSNTEKLLIKIKKQYKNKRNFFEMYLDNYNGFNLYFRIDYNLIKKVYELDWYDLNLMERMSVKKYKSSEYIPNMVIEHMKSILINSEIDNYNSYDKKYKNEKVTININSKDLKNKKIKIEFYKYIPKEIAYISEFLVILFNNLPKKLEGFLVELHAELQGKKEVYQYKNIINFDIKKGNIEELFTKIDLIDGEKIYQQGQIDFLEKIDNKYIALIRNNSDNHVVMINYDENDNLGVYCSCPANTYCKHICAVIYAIRNNFNKRFLKISYKKKNNNLLEKYFEFNYFLCVGYLNEYFIVINSNGLLELVPILNEQNELQWIILEDSEEGILLNYINKYISK